MSKISSGIIRAAFPSRGEDEKHMNKKSGRAAPWETLYGDFISMNDNTWSLVDRRLAQNCSPEKVDEILEDYVRFTKFIWTNVKNLQLDIDDSVIEMILKVRGADSLDNLGVDKDNLNALRPNT